MAIHVDQVREKFEELFGLEFESNNLYDGNYESVLMLASEMDEYGLRELGDQDPDDEIITHQYVKDEFVYGVFTTGDGEQFLEAIKLDISTGEVIERHDL